MVIQAPIIGTLKRNSNTFGGKKAINKYKTLGGHEYEEINRAEIFKNSVIKTSEKGVLGKEDKIVLVARGAKGKLMTISTGQQNQFREERVLPETNELEY